MSAAVVGWVQCAGVCLCSSLVIHLYRTKKGEAEGAIFSDATVSRGEGELVSQGAGRG